jgi:hypothetical protein
VVGAVVAELAEQVDAVGHESPGGSTALESLDAIFAAFGKVLGF